MWRTVTAVVTALVMVVLGLWSGTAAAAPPAKSPSKVQPRGDGGWKPATPPKSTTVPYTAKSGPGGPRVVKPDPKAKRVKELTDKRTANTSSFQMSDGSVQQEVSAVPVHYRDAKGAWQNIDSSVKPLSHDGFTLGAQGNSFQAYFSPTASSLLRVEQGAASVQVGADGASTGAPKVSGSSVSYAGAYPGADLSYQVGPDGVQESVALAKRPAAGQSYAFTLTVGAGLVPRQLKDGAIELAGSESGAAVFTIPAPYMADAKKDASSPYGTVYSRKVSQTMSFDAASGTVHVTVTPDAGWLADAKRVYPVRVDPTIVVAPTPSTAANTMIQQEDPNGNNSTSWRLSVGTTTNGPVRSLIRFPLPAIPSGTTIASADLALYYDQVFYDGTHDVPMQALQANAAWTPATATWANANTIGGPVAGSSTMKANVLADWVHFPVTSAVQNWVNGTANNGLVLKATNETTLGQGGPRFEGSIYAYGGEVVNYPKLTITYGVPGVAVNPPSVIHATGAELSWPGYTNTTGDPNNDAAEYQVHRSVFQTFTPGQSTLVSPTAATAFVDSTAMPTPANSSDPYGNFYYYMVAVKTKGGLLIGGPVTQVRLPKAGRTTLLIPATAAATLSSKLPTSNLTSLVDSGVSQPWLEVGDNSATYGTARSVFDFGALSQVPAGSRIIESHLKVWQETTSTNSSGAVYELHGLTRSFTGTQTTWNSAATGTAWTTVGGDFNATAAGTVSGLTNDPGRQTFDATSIVQGWVTTPSSDHGLLVKLKAETSKSPQERTIFAGRQTAESQLAPQLVVTYLDSSTDATYYAPSTPATMNVGTTYTVPVTINNTTTTTWAAANVVLTYHWLQNDGSDVTTGANQLQTALPSDLAPGSTATVNAQVTPPTPADLNELTGYQIAWDLYNKSTGTYLSAGTVGAAANTSPTLHPDATTTAATGGIGSLKQATGVQSGSNQLGLESFYQYATTPTGSGSALYTNVSSGNTVWNDNLFSNPSRGFATFLRLSYNSLDTTDTTTGFGWSIQASTPTRLGQALDFHPNPNPTAVTMDDGDGTSHRWTRNSSTSTWTSPPGVHVYLQQLDTCGPQTADARAWSMTKPDRTVFYYDCEGYPTAVVDRNGNEADFTYTDRKSENKPEEFLTYITDPASRQTLTLTYYNKGDNYSYLDSSTGQLVSGTGLTNPFIIDHVRSISDISGRTVTFTYTDKGLLGRLVDGDGTSVAKTFNFTYDMTQGNKNVKLIAVQDPRGNTTKLAYYDPPPAPQFHWWTHTVTSRTGGITSVAYTDPDGTSGSTIQTAVTDAENHTSTYTTDGSGRPISATDPLGRTTDQSWDADNNLAQVIEANGATTKYTYDANTGLRLTATDAEAVKNGYPAQVWTYQTSLNGHVADLTAQTTSRGSQTVFGYDQIGNLTSVTDPDGTATATVGDYTTTYTYDAFGQLQTAKDANGNTTNYGPYDVTGQVKTVTDGLQHSTSTGYDALGHVTSRTDPRGKTSTYGFDIFGRSMGSKVPKDQNAGQFIVTPAPTYDANDNVTVSVDATGAANTTVYDADDRVTSSTAPPQTAGSAQRVTTYTYDKVGNALTTTEPDGNLTATAGDFVTTNTYDAGDQLVSVTNADGDKTSYEYDSVGNVAKVISPSKNATADPSDYTTKYGYDLLNRQTAVTDADGNTSTTEYDKDGDVTATVDRVGRRTTMSYDPRGKETAQTVPYQTVNGTTTYRTTQFDYDQVGNRTRITSPRGTATDNPDDFATVTVYDAVGQVKETHAAYDPADPRYKTPDSTVYNYDEAGRLTNVTAPPSAGQTAPNVTRYSYFDNGWMHTNTDPWGIVSSYDYNDLGKQTVQAVASAGGSSSRTTTWQYYNDGSLASRDDAGVPVGLQVEVVDNSDFNNVTTTGTWTSSNTAGNQYGPDYVTHPAGTGTDSLTWQLNIPQAGNYQVYVYYPTQSGAATDARFTVTNATGSTTTTVNETANASSWVPIGSYAFVAGGINNVSVSDQATGTVVADAVKVVRDNSADTDNENHAFSYTYDANDNAKTVTDSSPGTAVDTYTIGYTDLNQVASVTGTLRGNTVSTATYTFNADGLPKTVAQDREYYSYTYDNRNLVAQESVGASATDPNPQVTTYGYTPAAQLDHQTKPNGNTVDYTYNLDTSQRSQIEKKADGTLVSQHVVDYDLNGNRTRDDATAMNADNHASQLHTTANYTYDPRNRVASATRTGDGAGTENYVYDANNNVTSETLNGSTTSFNYDRNRLLTSTTGAGKSSYNYDPFGRLDTVTQAGQVKKQYVYDGFDHIAKTQDGTATTTYTYDPLDRPSSTTSNAGTAAAETTNFAYLGLSDQVESEQVAGQVQKQYQYAPWGQLLSQSVPSSGGSNVSYYGYNLHTDVEQLTSSSGDTTATYGYTAYGDDNLGQFTGADKPNPNDPNAAPYNAYRFNGERWDPTSGTYDMGFRDYDPTVNRFITRDSYAGASTDLNLDLNPWTANRYAFAGGNPINGVEIDGHCAGREYGDLCPGQSLDSQWQAGTAPAPTQPDLLAPPDLRLPPLTFDPPAVPEVPPITPWLRALGVIGAVLMLGGDSGPDPERVQQTTINDEEQRCASQTGDQSEISYLPLDSKNRARGGLACLTPTAAASDFSAPQTPVGFETGMHRGHLIARQFGGNHYVENVVPMTPWANLTGMKAVEGEVRTRLNLNERVFYAVIPRYPNNDLPARPLYMDAYVVSATGKTLLQILNQ